MQFIAFVQPLWQHRINTARLTHSKASCKYLSIDERDACAWGSWPIFVILVIVVGAVLDKDVRKCLFAEEDWVLVDVFKLQ